MKSKETNTLGAGIPSARRLTIRVGIKWNTRRPTLVLELTQHGVLCSGDVFQCYWNHRELVVMPAVVTNTVPKSKPTEHERDVPWTKTRSTVSYLGRLFTYLVKVDRYYPAGSKCAWHDIGTISIADVNYENRIGFLRSLTIAPGLAGARFGREPSRSIRWLADGAV